VLLFSGFGFRWLCSCSYCGPIPAGSVWLSIKVFKSFGSRTSRAYATAHSSQLTAHHAPIQEFTHRCPFRGPLFANNNKSKPFPFPFADPGDPERFLGISRYSHFNWSARLRFVLGALMCRNLLKKLAMKLILLICLFIKFIINKHFSMTFLGQ